MEYQKIDTTFKERLLFLFTGLLSKKYLIIENKGISIPQVKQEENNDINNIEEVKVEDTDFKMDDIPFFDLDNSNTKSNL